ncbi:hypothetical protein PGT21_030846 [Puccinia graminis f. sp. tritici]|uniref:Cytochrome b5 heme-binding domain-containing protein n=1 Tax=Puccinia graminis f. sp. tritici TaxID=56615 RepID=A0A5B0MYH7_PUCGR|nr:hypothetical protein PGT21_030846 [Puccinia graminis f. sp. tritici]KAA1131337.1 hypothetical protein PGTUg99_031977 [Puccinia graminis f. sp. tritici]
MDEYLESSTQNNNSSSSSQQQSIKYPRTTTRYTQPSSPPTALNSSVTNFDLNSLIEQNNLSEDSCLLVVHNKVYDLTLWLQAHLSCNLDHHQTQTHSHSPASTHRSASPPSPPPSPTLQRSHPSQTETEQQQQPNQFDQLLQTAKSDPVQAGHLLRSIYDEQPFKTDGSSLHDWLSDYRIGDFAAHPSSSSSSFSAITAPSSIHHYLAIDNPNPYWPNQNIHQGPSGSLSPSSSHTSTGGTSTSTNTGRAPSTIPGRSNPPIGSWPSHLERANELVRLSKQRVMDAQRGVGVANLSLADAFAQLAEADKIKDHLVLQALEGCRPIWPDWTDNNSS